MLGNSVLKTIPDFCEHASDLHTSFDAVCDAYRAANEADEEAAQGLGHSFLVKCIRKPSLSERGHYSVITAPCGYEAKVYSEQVQRFESHRAYSFVLHVGSCKHIMSAHLDRQRCDSHWGLAA